MTRKAEGPESRLFAYLDRISRSMTDERERDWQMLGAWEARLITDREFLAYLERRHDPIHAELINDLRLLIDEEEEALDGEVSP